MIVQARGALRPLWYFHREIMKFLFWNTHGNDNINDLLRDLIIENRIDIVVLAEYKANIIDLCSGLSCRGVRMQPYPSGVGEKKRLTVLGTIDNVLAGTQTRYESIQIINNDLILCCIHLPSKIFTRGSKDRKAAIRKIIADIQKVEEKNDTKNTIIVGDFNVNPYEEECMGFEYFHSIPFIDGKKTSRIIGEEEYEFFYNPMWNFLGDFHKPYGTYYHSGSDTYWNTIDQVIIRPALKDRFKTDGLRIVVGTCDTSILNSEGYPDKTISDHLPIVFEVEDHCE